MSLVNWIEPDSFGKKKKQTSVLPRGETSSELGVGPTSLHLSRIQRDDGGAGCFGGPHPLRFLGFWVSASGAHSVLYMNGILNSDVGFFFSQFFSYFGFGHRLTCGWNVRFVLVFYFFIFDIMGREFPYVFFRVNYYFFFFGRLLLIVRYNFFST